MSSNESQDLTAPLVIAFLNQVRQEQYRQQRQHAQDQMSRRAPERDPSDLDAWIAGLADETAERVREASTTVFVLDEMYGIAPIPDLPNMLSQGGSQGVIVAAVQDLALIKDRWKIAGESFLTLFQDGLVYPGIRHRETLEMVSSLIGDYDREVQSTSTAHGHGIQGPTYTDSTTFQRQRRIAPDEVSRGPVPGDPDVLIRLSPQGSGQLYATPFWRAAPWPHVLTDCIEVALGAPESMWAQYLRMMDRPEPEPPPIMPLQSQPAPKLPQRQPWMTLERRGGGGMATSSPSA
jgi:hypothetical protein